MQRSAGFVAAMFVLAAACSATGDAPDTSTTQTSGLSTTTSTTSEVVSTTTDTDDVGPVQIGRLSRLDPGEPGLYESGTFPAFQAEFDLAGWKVDETGSSWIQFSNSNPDAGPGVWGAVVAFRPEDSLDRLAEYFLLPEHQLDFDDHGMTTLNGRTTRQIDVHVPPRDPPGRPDVGAFNYFPGDGRCSQQVEFYVDDVLSHPQFWAQGLVGCAWNRVVIVDVEGISMLLTVSPNERSFDHINQLDELGPYVDDFINAITFCTGATPCPVTTAETPVANRVDLDDGTPTPLTPEVAFFHDLLEVEIQLEVSKSGWVERATGVRSVEVEYLPPQGGRGTRLIMFLLPDDVTTEELRATIEGSPITATGDDTAVVIDGWDGISFDVELARSEVDGPNPCPDVVLIEDQALGQGAELKLEGCSTSRMWLLDVAGTSIAIFATDNVSQGTRDRPDYETDLGQLEPQLDQLINAITFCTEATPCDG